VGAVTQPEYIGYIAADTEEEEPLRHLFVLSLDDDEPWPADLGLPTSQFTLFLAWDADRQPVDRIESIAKACLGHGVVLICTWGPGCERVHDLFDRVEFERNPNLDPPFVTTFWHAHETLDEALSSFIFTFSSDSSEGELPTPRSCVVCSFGDEFGVEIRSRMANLQGLYDRAMAEFIASLPPNHELRTEDEEPYVVDFVPAASAPPLPRWHHE